MLNINIHPKKIVTECGYTALGNGDIVKTLAEFWEEGQGSCVHFSLEDEAGQTHLLSVHWNDRKKGIEFMRQLLDELTWAYSAVTMTIQNEVRNQEKGAA